MFSVVIGLGHRQLILTGGMSQSKVVSLVVTTASIELSVVMVMVNWVHTYTIRLVLSTSWDLYTHPFSEVFSVCCHGNREGRLAKHRAAKQCYDTQKIKHPYMCIPPGDHESHPGAQTLGGSSALAGW